MGARAARVASFNREPKETDMTTEPQTHPVAPANDERLIAICSEWVALNAELNAETEADEESEAREKYVNETNGRLFDALLPEITETLPSTLAGVRAKSAVLLALSEGKTTGDAPEILAHYLAEDILRVIPANQAQEVAA
jgi:hypothetical protein